MRTGTGRKAANLERLRAAGFRMPEFITVAADETEAIARGGEAANRFLRAYARWADGLGIDAVAVRSSAEVEDGAERSWAGAFETVLDVHGSDELLDAVRRVSTSGPAGVGPIGVIVQQLIRPDVSGVLFTRGPDGAFILNAAPGLAAVVGGEACDQYFLAPETGDERSRSLAGEASSLTREEIGRLYRLGIEIERLFGSPQDVEWAIASGQIHVLQSRPVTAIEPDLRVWDSSNIAESYPGVTLPLTISVARRGYALVYEGQGRASGLSAHTLAEHRRLFERMLGVFRGHLFYNLDAWYEFASMFPGGDRTQQRLDRMLQTDGTLIHRRAERWSPTRKVRWYLKLALRIAWFDREIRAFDERLEQSEQALAAMPAAQTARDALDRYLFIEGHLLPHWHTTVDNDYIVMMLHAALESLLARWAGPDVVARKTELLAGVRDVQGAGQALALEELVESLRAHPDLWEILRAGELSTLMEAIDGSGIERRLADYRARYGSRSGLDLKLEVPDQLDDPINLLRLVKAYSELPAGTLAGEVRAAADAAARTEAELLDALPIHQRATIRTILRRLKRHVRDRERMRALRARAFSHGRQAFRELGRLLQLDGVLDRADDIYFLEVDELIWYVEGSLSIDRLAPLAAVRRHEYDTYRNTTVPDRFVTRGLAKMDVPSSDAVPSSGTELQGLPSSGGIAQGHATVMLEPQLPDDGIEILVVRHTDPAWTPILALATGVVVERGGVLSHAAIVTRELGIPAVVGVTGATKMIEDGALVSVDGWRGTVRIRTE